MEVSPNWRLLTALSTNFTAKRMGLHTPNREEMKILWFFEYFTMKRTNKDKGKVHSLQALRHCTSLTAHRGSKGIALPIHEQGTKREWGVSVTPGPLFTPGKDPVLILQKTGWAPGPVWTGAENLVPPGFDPQTVQPVASCYNDWATRPTTHD
jgi:hypothetical protein